MVYRRTLTHGIKIFYVSLMLKVYGDAAHEEMHRRFYRDALARDVDTDVFHAEIIDLGYALHYLLPTEERDVEVDLLSCLVDAPRDNISWHEITLRSELILHEVDAAVSVHVIEPSALTSRGLRHKHLLLRGPYRRRVILYELEVLKIHALHEETSRRVTVVKLRARRLAKQAVLSSCRHYNGVSSYYLCVTGCFIEDYRAVASSVLNEGAHELRSVSS